MPYMLVGNCVHKQTEDGKAGEVVPGGCHKTEQEAKNHMSALYANVKNSEVVEFSMRISKASYNKSENEPMRWTAIDSDTDEDLYQERMSVELYKDFVSRIENKTPIPEPFKSVVCESDWCGGMPYLSIAHYKAGTSNVNVPGEPTSVFVDGRRLKSKGILHDTEMGRRVFKALCKDEVEKSNVDHKPVRISIGFLDLEHKHLAPAGGQEYTFTRTEIGQICPLCSQGIGGKIYMKGQLIHLAMTRVPVNPRTQMVAEKSMDAIQTKRDDAESIIGDLVNELEEKSIASDVLVVRAEDGSAPKDNPSELSKCYDPNTDSFKQECIDGVMNKYMADIRSEIGTTVKSVLADVIEEAKRKDVSPADKKRAEKEYGDVKYADETNKKYPIDTKEHAKAALSYWGMPKNREKYSPEDQKKIGGRIRAAAKKFGIEIADKKSDTVEDTMDEVKNESVAGIPEKPFSFTQDGVTVTGDGNNTIANPVKAKTDDEEAGEGDKAGDEDMEHEKMMKKSALDVSYEALKSTLANAKSVEDVQKAFNALGAEVEKAYVPEQKPVGGGVDAETFKSLLNDALAPINIRLAQLEAKSNNTVSTEKVVKSKALNISQFTKPEQMIQKSDPKRDPNDNVPMQIRSIARKSTGLQ